MKLIRQQFITNNFSKRRHSKNIFKKVFSFLRINYVLTITLLFLSFVGLVVVYKLFIAKPTYVYAKIKVGQGTWWANTQKPNIWFVKAIQQAKEQKDLTGKPIVTVLDVSYYPYYTTNQYDVYVAAKLKVSKTNNNGTYSFNHEMIGISSPISMEFSNVQFSGTIIALSEKPIKETYEYKNIYLYKKNVSPWEYDQIQIGDAFTNGDRIMFKILSKEKGETNDLLLSDFGRLINAEDMELYRYVTVKAKIKIKRIDNQSIYGEETIVSTGKMLGVITDHSALSEYVVVKVE